MPVKQIVADGREKVPVVVLGSGVTGLSAMRILARRGLAPYYASVGDPLGSKSRWFRPLPGESLNHTQLPFQEWVTRLPFERAVLIPCADRWALAVAKLDPALRERFPASVAAAAVIEHLVDKGKFAELLAKEQVPHPWTRLVAGAADLSALPDAAFQSAIIKPRDSQSFVAAYGVKAFRVASRSDAAERLDLATRGGHPAILQQYVPGPASNHYFIDGFIDRTGVVRAAFARRRLRMHPEDFGNSTFMKSVPVREAQSAADTILSLLGRMNYRGVFSAEFKRDADDGAFKLLEVNARPWWYVDFAAHCGVDVCTMSYDDALERPVATVERYAVGKTLVYPYVDLFACLELRRRRQLSLAAWAWSWLRSTQPILQPGDPKPGLLSMWVTASGFIGRRVRRFGRWITGRGRAQPA